VSPAGARLVPAVVAVERLLPVVSLRVRPDPRSWPFMLPVAFMESVPVNRLTDVKCVGIPLLARKIFNMVCSLAIEANASLYSTPNR
jgi:hypothetical protein